jgi:hypothetical protein
VDPTRLDDVNHRVHQHASAPPTAHGALLAQQQCCGVSLELLLGRGRYRPYRWLGYVKGGAAWAGDKYDAVGVFQGTPYDFEGLETRLGWTAGVGVEWALWDDWSIKLEYDYYGFGQRNVTFIASTIMKPVAHSLTRPQIEAVAAMSII